MSKESVLLPPMSLREELIDLWKSLKEVRVVLLAFGLVLATILALLIFVVAPYERSPHKTFGGTPLSYGDWVWAQQTAGAVDGGMMHVVYKDPDDGATKYAAEIIILKDRHNPGVFHARYWNTTGVESPMSLSLVEYRRGPDGRLETRQIDMVTTTGPDLVAYANGRVAPGWCVAVSYAAAVPASDSPRADDFKPSPPTCVS